MKAVVQTGRLDQALLAILERLCKTHVEAKTGVEVWDRVKPTVTRELSRLRVPKKPLTPEEMNLASVGLDLARAICARRLRVS
jgi:hypothetical protein